MSVHFGRRLATEASAVFTCHGVVVLLQRGGVDDAPEEAAVADGVLFPLVAFVQQLVVQEEQLAAQRVKLIQRSRACGSHGDNIFKRTACSTRIRSSRNKPNDRVLEQRGFKKKKTLLHVIKKKTSVHVIQLL